ncbi:MAG: helix-turn-helix transcriptional regulator [Candidatus Competibacter sp.]
MSFSGHFLGIFFGHFLAEKVTEESGNQRENMNKINDKSNIYEESDRKNPASLSGHFRSEENNAFKHRLKSVIGDESLRSFAHRTGLSPTVVRQYVIGKSLPTLDSLITLIKTTNVNLLWLATGEGPKYPGEPAAPGQIDLKSLQLALEMVEQALETRRRVTDPENKAQIVAAVYDLFAGNQPVEKAKVLKLIKTMA